MESSPDLDKMRLRCMDNAEPKSSLRTMVFRSNPLPQLKLFVTNTQDHVYSEDEVDFKVSQQSFNTRMTFLKFFVVMCICYFAQL